MNINSDRIALFFFILSLLFTAFAAGIVAHKYKLFPYSALVNVKKMFEKPESEHFLHPIRYRFSGVKIHDASAVYPGVTLLTSFWPQPQWQPGARLIDIQGKTLYHWNINPVKLWGVSPWNYIHGSYLFANGDILINIEYQGLARVGVCGNILWKLPFRTHHSISRDGEGNFWVSGIKTVSNEENQDRLRLFPDLKPPFEEEYAVKVSPQGDILLEISLLKALFDSGYKYLLWKYASIEGDVVHLNDVEVLSKKMAGNFPMFNAGDLLVSFKHISSVVVLDQSAKVKWIDSHYFNRQHDPDFAADGTIVVFDNREDRTFNGAQLGGSALTAINPVTGITKPVYPIDDNQFFYTNAGGKHQLLGNGNRLITEVRAGRIFEINRAGETVWEWVQGPYNDKLVAEVMEGTRYSLTTEQVGQWQCEK